jgi:hypothetical protein
VSLHFWVVAMNEEIESLHKNQTWDLVKLPEGTKTIGLRRSLYSLEQSPGQWYKHFVYCGKFSYGFFVFLLLYVDYMLIVVKHMFEVERLKSLLGDEFEMKDMGGANKILWLVSTPYDAHFKLSVMLPPQSEVAERSMSHVSYSSVVGSYTRLDIPQVINVVSPCKVYWQAVKWILYYLYGATIFGLVFDRGSCLSSNVILCVDSDCIGHLVAIHGVITLKKIGMAENPADMLTKPVSVLKFKSCLDLIGVCSL